MVLYPFVDWWLRSIEVAGAYRYHDFGAFRAAVERWHAGEALYQRAEDGGFHGSYLYPPVVLPCFCPSKDWTIGPPARRGHSSRWSGCGSRCSWSCVRSVAACSRGSESVSCGCSPGSIRCCSR
ncbi:hypothetical protein ACFQL4_00825 [Halosimplex aquaticum]